MFVRQVNLMTGAKKKNYSADVVSCEIDASMEKKKNKKYQTFKFKKIQSFITFDPVDRSGPNFAGVHNKKCICWHFNKNLLRLPVPTLQGPLGQNYVFSAGSHLLVARLAREHEAT